MTSINSRLSLHYGHGAFIAASILPTTHHLTLIHQSAWNRNSAKLNFRFIEFCEVELPIYGVLRSSRQVLTAGTICTGVMRPPTRSTSGSKERTQCSSKA